MSIFLTQLAADNFQRTNENPLAHPPWAVDSHGDPSLQIVSNLCEPTSTSLTCAELYTGTSLPNDQYASATLAAVPSGNFWIGIRTTDNGSGVSVLPGYTLRVSGGNWQVQEPTGGSILSGSGLTISSGDVFIIAVVGTTIFVLQNGVQFGQVTNTAQSSGSALLVAVPFSSLTSVQFSNFACGSTSTSPGGTGTGYSVPDCRVAPAGPNSSRVVQGTLIYDVQTSSNPAVPGIDSRASGAPVDSRQSGQAPLNSRTPGTYGPGVN